jgi:hypothetical protein
MILNQLVSLAGRKRMRISFWLLSSLVTHYCPLATTVSRCFVETPADHRAFALGKPHLGCAKTHVANKVIEALAFYAGSPGWRMSLSMGKSSGTDCVAVVHTMSRSISK